MEHQELRQRREDAINSGGFWKLSAKECLAAYAVGERDFHYADLSDADLRCADLSAANLSDADLSAATGVLTGRQWLVDNFEQDGLGLIVFKAIGNTSYAMPEQWEIEPGAFLEEVVNPLPTVACGCGVNFGTLAFIHKEYSHARSVWKCRIRWIDLADVVVPYGTDGKARCGRLELVDKIR